MKHQDSANIKPLMPHKYNILIYGFVILILISMIYSIYLLHKYFKAAKMYHQAKISYQENHYAEAIKKLKPALMYAPSSVNVKFLLAKAYFASGGDENAKLALNALEGLNIDKYKYSELKAVMPAEYEQLFITKKRY